MTAFTDITTASWDDALGAIERGYELGLGFASEARIAIEGLGEAIVVCA